MLSSASGPVRTAAALLAAGIAVLAGAGGGAAAADPKLPPGVYALPANDKSCYDGMLCVYRDLVSEGGGYAVLAGFDIPDLSRLPTLGGVLPSKNVSSYRNLSGFDYCLHDSTAVNTKEPGRLSKNKPTSQSMPAGWNDRGSSIRVC